MKLKTISWPVIDGYEFSDFVAETYGRPYDVAQHVNGGDPAANDSMNVIYVEADPGYVDPDEQDTFEAWCNADVNAPVPDEQTEYALAYNEEHKDEPDFIPAYIPEQSTNLPGGFHHTLHWKRNPPPLGPLLTDMCRKGLIDEGKYLISVSW